MSILAIETSTARGSLAVLQEDALVFQEDVAGDRALGSQLFPALERALEAALPIDQIVVGLGPGSHSGVRIAIAAAIGLRLSLGARLIGLPSLAAMPAEEYCAVGDARRGAWFFARVRGGECLEGPMLLSPEEARRRLDPALPAFTSAPLEDFIIAYPTAERLARLAQQGSISATGALEPIYLREPHITPPRPRPSSNPARPARSADS